ncbi:MAG TPA: haloacid dehalogenase type II [Methylibium sp.]|uniref:haloacid dehalogenase type II n=1 Tax=Methylibium sp. TaxID=2067992 RepID=UPI002DBB1243|nr:haloacid dehalogenase type II [Methylibium sp.]HEU4457608.1 haloacid dehalogenase type II [Methylibium sp.]
MTGLDPPHRALVFDVFGTVVDWHASIVREGELLGAQLGRPIDWPAFARRWRAGYQPALSRVRDGSIGWVNVDELHRQLLDGLIAEFGLEALTPAQREHLNRVWHRLAPWPDVPRGLARLKAGRIVATLSNGHVALLVDLARFGGLPWDCVLSAELFQAYKPQPEVYRGAAALLGFEPHEVTMVAAHPSDLHAARDAGLRTAYVRRPLEYGLGEPFTPAPDADFDIAVDDFDALAARLGD